jgi:hypothetical protein
VTGLNRLLLKFSRYHSHPTHPGSLALLMADFADMIDLKSMVAVNCGFQNKPAKDWNKL